MDICLLDNESGIGKINSTDILFLWYRWKTDKELCKSNLQNLRIDKVLSNQDRRLVESETIRISENWYRIAGVDFTNFKGISLGSLYEWDLYNQCNFSILFLIAIKRAVERHSPRVIYHHFHPQSDVKKILDVIACYYNVKLEHTGGKTSNVDFTFQNFGTYVRPKKRWLVSLLGVVINIIGLIFRKHGANSAILFHTGNQHLTHVLREWLRNKSGLGAVIDLYSRPPLKLMMQFIKKGGVFIRRSSYSKPNLSEINKKWRLLKTDSRYKRFLDFEGISLKPLFDSLLDKIVFSHFAGEAATIEQYYNAYKLNKIKCVVLPNDCVLRQKLAVFTAKRAKAASIVVQHGLGGQSHDKDKTMADYSLIWSEKTREICKLQGVSMEKLIVTGAPALDAYSVINISPISKQPENLLILTSNSPFGSFSSPTYGEDLIITIMKALEGFNQFKNVIIKIHPSESVEYYKNITSGFRCMVEKERPIMELLRNSDIVIGGLTTALIEARIMRKPIILVIEEVFYKKKDFWPPFNQENGILVAANTQELKLAIGEILKYPDRFCNNQHIGFDDYLGSIDGNSTRRAYEFISELAHKR